MSREPTGLSLYDRTAQEAAATVIDAYSTSFSLACRLLGARVRPHVKNIYALVRIADEIVDGPASEAGLNPAQERRALDALEVATLEAIDEGFSSNLIVHAFARTARECGIDSALIAPFFASMRTDLSLDQHTPATHDEYVYGSAEVVGLMCLQVFVNAGHVGTVTAHADLVDGARRLGAAFQDVNFLRDAQHDQDSLGREYLPLHSRNDRLRALESIDADLLSAARVINKLPRDCRRAVSLAHDLFAELADRLHESSSQMARVRVPNGTKAVIAAKACLRSGPRKERS